jgi:hypothetical protein
VSFFATGGQLRSALFDGPSPAIVPLAMLMDFRDRQPQTPMSFY